MRADPRTARPLLLASTLLGIAGACVSVEPLAPDPEPSPEPRRVAEAAAPAEVGEEIVVCGRRYAIGAPVVLWTDPGGYDAYRGWTPGAGPARGFRPGRRAQPALGTPAVPPDCADPALLARAVDQFVLHYDVCGVSRTCFRVLDQRGLSVHFLLDLDGTIYQTLDLRDTAWHATKANDRSVGVEIAQIGAYTRDGLGVLEEWYSRDARGLFVDLPARLGDGGLRTPGFRGRPLSPELAQGRINGTQLYQYDFTAEQYRSLIALTRGLRRALPRIRAAVPRDASGAVATDQLDDAAFEAFSGVIGHNHVQENKYDPGPAFDWERLVQGSR